MSSRYEKVPIKESCVDGEHNVLPDLEKGRAPELCFASSASNSNGQPGGEEQDNAGSHRDKHPDSLKQEDDGINAESKHPKPPEPSGQKDDQSYPLRRRRKD